MSARQKGRYNLSRKEKRKRKHERRMIRMYGFHQHYSESKPDWFERNGELLINAILLFIIVAMLAFLFSVAIKNG